MKKESLASKKITLFISIFYAEKDWHILLREGVFPFLKDANTVFEFNYLIHLNKERGDNIGLTIHLNSLSTKEFLSMFNIFLNKFLKRYPSVSEPENSNDVPLFINFPNNSIHYGLHKFYPKFSQEYAERLIKTLEQSSVIFLKELSKTAFLIEDACSIVIYSNIALLLTNPFLIELYKKDFLSELQNLSMVSEFEDRYQINQELMSEIFQDCLMVLKSKSVKKELRWLIKINSVFNSFISCAREYYGQRNQRIEIDIFRVVLLVSRNQLGINLKGSMFIDYALHRILNIQNEKFNSVLSAVEK